MRVCVGVYFMTLGVPWAVCLETNILEYYPLAQRL